MLISPLIPAAVAAGIGFLGQERSNRVNVAEAARNRAWQSGEAALNRSFQERMRNTEWQAAVEDARAAGINPMALTGGASSPGGSMGGGAQASVENSVSSAIQAMRARKDLELLEASIDKVQQEGRSARAEADVATERSRMLTQGRLGEDGRGPSLLRHQVDAEVRTAMANMLQQQAMAQISGVGGQVAQGVMQFSRPFQEVMRTAGQGWVDLNQLLSRAFRRK